MVLETGIPGVGNIQLEGVRVTSEPRGDMNGGVKIGNSVYPLERWLNSINCSLEDVKEVPLVGVAPGQCGNQVIIYYRGVEPADSVAELIADNISEDVMLQCSCVGPRVLV